jgi:uncharacterized protein (DUF849 family)
MSKPRILVAPNGARRQKTDHANLPISPIELAKTAASCEAAGANGIHLHVREPDGRHSLDPKLYQAAISAIQKTAPNLDIQITTEAAGIYDVHAQLALLQNLKPKAASISIREIARDRQLAPKVYATAQRNGTAVQHILYGELCFERLIDWMASDIIPSHMNDAILVLGQYAPPKNGNPQDLTYLIRRAQKSGFHMTVCAFGSEEQTCLLAAALLGCDLRIGFENNILAPDGTPWESNAQAVKSLCAALAKQTSP